MRSIQRRWLCHTCKREWVYAIQFDDKHCPNCGHSEIERVEYLPAFPGADIHTELKVSWVDDGMKPAPIRPNLQRERNEALMHVDPYSEQLSALLGVSI